MKSKTLATWIALIGGPLGLHRFYLHGWRDAWGWLHPWPTLAGLYGIERVRELGQDDHLSWALIPLLGFVIAASMLCAILYGLMPDERWDLRRGVTYWVRIGKLRRSAASTKLAPGAPPPLPIVRAIGAPRRVL